LTYSLVSRFLLICSVGIVCTERVPKKDVIIIRNRRKTSSRTLLILHWTTITRNRINVTIRIDLSRLFGWNLRKKIDLLITTLFQLTNRHSLYTYIFTVLIRFSIYMASKDYY